MDGSTAREDQLASGRRHLEQATQAAAEARRLLTPEDGVVSEEHRAEGESLMRLADSYAGLARLALRIAGPADGEVD